VVTVVEEGDSEVNGLIGQGRPGEELKSLWQEGGIYSQQRRKGEGEEEG